MASSRGSCLRYFILVILAVKQIASPGEAGKPFYGYGDQGGRGVMDYQPSMVDRYDFQCSSWPFLSAGYPPVPYGEYGSARQGSTPNYAGTQQWVYVCVLGKSGVPAHAAYVGSVGSYENNYPSQYIQQPTPRQIRSGPYFFPSGPPPFPDFFNQPMPFPPPPPEYFERPWKDFGPAMRAGEWGGGSLEASGTSLKTSIVPAPVQRYENEDIEQHFPAFPELQIFTGSPPAPPSGCGSGGRRPGAGSSSSYFSSQNAQYTQNAQNAQYIQNGMEGFGPRPMTGPNSRAPIQFEPPSTDSPENSTTTTTMSTVTRSYSPYTRYGLQLIQ